MVLLGFVAYKIYESNKTSDLYYNEFISKLTDGKYQRIKIVTYKNPETNKQRKTYCYVYNLGEINKIYIPDVDKFKSKVAEIMQ